jgi:hypothetical protein
MHVHLKHPAIAAFELVHRKHLHREDMGASHSVEGGGIFMIIMVPG